MENTILQICSICYVKENSGALGVLHSLQGYIGKLFQNAVQCDMQHWMITLAASLLNNDVVQKGD